MRLTRQRNIILSEVREAKDHPSADELYRRVRSTLPKISLGTVYRNLEYLTENGLIRKVEIGGGQRRFDPVLEDHAHFRCVRCGEIEDVPFEVLLDESGCKNQSWMEGRTIFGNNVEYYGICPACGNGHDG